MKKPSRFIYAGFVLLALYYLFIQKDMSSASIQLGIALAFDPFNQEQPWKERPRWQQVWLILHLSIVLVLILLQLQQYIN